MSKLKKIQLILGSIIILLIVFIPINKEIKKSKNKIDKQLVENYFDKKKKAKESTKELYIGVIEIPKIKLRKGFYSVGNPNNTIEKNVMLIEENNNTIVLAAHSGNADIAYFNDLYLLNKSDEIKLYYHDKLFIYQVYYKYLDDKNGSIELKQAMTERLVLVTCNNHDKNNYLVVEAYLKRKLL